MGFLGPLLGAIIPSIFGGMFGKAPEPKQIQKEVIPTMMPQQMSAMNWLLGGMMKMLGADPNLLFGGQDLGTILTTYPGPFYPRYNPSMFGSAWGNIGKPMGSSGLARPGGGFAYTKLREQQSKEQQNK